MKVNIKTEFRGEQRVQVMKDGLCVQDTGFMPNLITDLFYQDLTTASGASYTTNKCYVGTGTTPPTVSDIYMENEVAEVSSAGVSYEVNSEDDVIVATMTRVFTFGQGDVSANISTIATTILNGDSTDLHTYAQIVDANGDPTVISVTEENQLIITHKFSTYYKSADTTGTVIDDNGLDSYTWTMRLVNISSSNASYMGIPLYWSTAFLEGSGLTRYFSSDNIPQSLSIASGSEGLSIPDADVHETGSIYKSKMTYNIPTDEGNEYGEIAALGVGPSVRYVLIFDPVIPKTSDYTLAVTLTYTFGRYVDD